MFKNYFKTAIRNLVKSKGYSAINIGGLSVGMAVVMLIGLWIWDEFSWDKNFKNYDRIVQVMQHQTFNGQVGTQVSNPAVMGQEIRDKFGSDFKYVLQSSWNFQHTLALGDKKFLKEGSYFEKGVIDMLSLNILKGSRDALKEPYSIALSSSIAQAIFGNDDPINKVIKIDNKYDVKVTAVYEDIPFSSSFRELKFILPWELYLVANPWIQKMENPWGSNFTQTFAMMADKADIKKVSAKLHDLKYNKVSADEKKYRAIVFLHPMSKWHLFADFKNGVNSGGRIQYVWLFGMIGLFVLLLACINFMNLSTARSEKRAKEVGVRKAIGSERKHLVVQFFSESFVVVFIALLLSYVLVAASLPFFNDIADKKLALLWNKPIFWLIGLGVSLITALIAGSYPALYLSSFNPIKVLKGTFRASRLAAIPRQVLVVLQFSVSVVLVIFTIVVYKQIQHAKDRAVGYNKESLVFVSLSETIHSKYEALRNELKSNNAIVEMSESTSPPIAVWNTNGGFDWEGRDPSLALDFPNNGVSQEFGKVMNWQIVQGRDFSREFKSDTAAFILNESAVKFIGWKDPIGKILKWEGKPYTVVGVIKDMLVESPYEPIRAMLFHVATDGGNVIILKMNPQLSASEALAKIESTFRKYDPGTSFEFNFVDEQFARKFGEEERVGKLATCFAVLAIFISCLGLFGLASFVAEQRKKEIGIRKVLGASVSNVWGLLSKQFMLLVGISLLVSVPTAYILMKQWLMSYSYRTGLTWWVFVLAAGGAVFITLLTVSFQAIRAATSNPIKSLRSE